MFAPSRDESRQFLASAWRKHKSGLALSGLEPLAASVVAAHPEYQGLLDDQTSVARDFPPEAGGANPFLHLSLHMAVAEQLSIDQPAGIRAEFTRLKAARGDEHGALHAVLECLGEVLWQSQRLGQPPDAATYLECLARQK